MASFYRVTHTAPTALCTLSLHDALPIYAVLGVAAAGRREHALALDFDHAGAAVAVRAHAFLVAEVRDVDAVMLGRLDEGLVRPADDGLAVQLELDRHCRRLRGA